VKNLAWIALLAIACTDAPTVQTAAAARKSLVVPILADGTLEPPAGGEVRAPEAAVVGVVLVREGQRVARSAWLVRLDNPDLSQRVLSSRSESQQIGAALAAVLRDRDEARSIAESDARLVKSGAITRFELEQANEKLRQADAQVADLTRRKVIAENSTRGLEARAGQMILRAPADGVVYNLPRPGESVAPGQLVATVSDPQHVRVRARVDAPDLPRVQAGQRIVVTFDGLPNQRWQGRVILVPPGLRQAGAREVGEVIGEISGDAGALPANATVNVEIVVGEKANALTVPRGALQRDGATRFVYRLIDDKAVRTPIQTGLIAPTDVEILSGLKEGDRVIVPGGVQLHDQQAVKASE
jgi:RND family efflux transporter MFP subunit